MRRIAQVLTVLFLAVAIVTPCVAQKKKRQRNQLPAALRKAIEKVDLTDEQTAKVKELTKEYAPKLAECKLDRTVTKARAEAMKKARAEGKKGKELQAVGAAVLSDEQKATHAKFQELNQELRAAVIAVMTDEQLDEAGLKRPRQKKKKG